MNSPTYVRRLIVFLFVSCAISVQVRAQTWSGGDIANNTNWSDGNNWAGNVAPTSGSAVVFPDGFFPLSTNGQGLVNNAVQSSTAIASLTYNNQDKNFDTTLIPAGVALMVTGNLSVGASDAAGSNTVVTITGGGSLFAGTSGTATLSGQNGSGQNIVSTLDMSGLSNFTFNAGGSSPGSINLGTGGSGSSITVNLAAESNVLSASTLNIGNNNTRGTVILNLGNGTNIVNADTIDMGFSKTAGTMQFLNNAGGGLAIANHTGTGRSTINISGEGSSGSTSAANNGFMLLSGGTVNILASTVTIGNRTTRAEASATGEFTFSSGTMDATTIDLALNSSGGTPSTGMVLVADSGLLRIGTGGLSMVNQGGSAGSGILIVTNGGTVVCSNNIYKTTANGVANIVLSDASLSVAGTIGVSNGVPIDDFSITNSTLTAPAIGVGQPEVALVNFNADATTQNTINISSMPAITSFPSQFPIIGYQVASGNLNTFVLGTLPGLPGTFSGFISNNTTALSIDLVITSGPISKSDLWTGAVNDLWDTTTRNWTTGGIATNYNDLDEVTFDDTATIGTVNLTATRTPATVNGLTFNNSSTNYTFTGPGSIRGGSGLTMNGTASVKLSESGGDSFTGGILLNAGTLILDDTNSTISGGMTVESGAIAQIGNNDGGGALPGGTLDDEGTLIFDRANNLTVGTVIPGVGAVVQNGSGILTFTAANTYSGNTTVNNGTLALSGGGSIVDSPNVDVTNATLDVSAVTTPATLPAVAISNTVVNVKVGYQQTDFSVSSLTMSGPSDTVNVRSLPPIAFYPATNVLIQSSGAIVGNNFVLGTLPTASPAYGGSIALSSDSTALLLILTSGPIGVRPTVTWSGADAIAGVSTNWSDAQNWLSPGTPVIGEPVVFNNDGAVGGSVFSGPGQGSGGITSPTSINNIVDINSTNSGLNYANGSFHNTLINPGKSLNVIGSLTVTGGGGTATILGSGGTLIMSNPASASILNVESASARTLDMSGLDTFNGTVSQIGVGIDFADNGSTVNGAWYLAKTNTITTSSGFSGIGAALIVGGANSQDGAGTGSVYLGQTNVLFVDGIAVGVGPSIGNLMTFNPAVTNNNPGVFIRGIAGNLSRVTQWSLGDSTVNLNNHAPGSGHITDFSAGVINAMVSTFDVGQGSQCNTLLPTNEFSGMFNMGAGILDVTTLRIGLSGGNGAGDGIGIMNVTGGTVVANTFTFAVSGQTNTSGTLNLTNATLVLSNGISIGASTAGGTLSLIGSTVKLLNDTAIGSSTVPLTTLILDDGTLQLYADATATSADIVGGTVDATNLTTINIASVSNVSGSAQIPLISYTNSTIDPYTNLVLGTIPAGYTVGNGGALVDNTGNQSVDVILNAVVTSPSTNATITHVSLSGTNMVVQGTNNNVPNTSFHYAVLTSTNVALPLSDWAILSTNPFNADGTFDYTNPIVPGTPQQFIDVEAVP